MVTLIIIDRLSKIVQHHFVKEKNYLSSPQKPPTALWPHYLQKNPNPIFMVSSRLIPKDENLSKPNDFCPIALTPNSVTRS